MHFPVIDEPIPSREAAQEDVLRHIHVGDQVEFLINDIHPHALCYARIEDLDLLSIEIDFPLIRRINAGKNLHQGRFPGAVFAQQDMGLPGFELEIHFVQSTHARKDFGDTSRLHNCPLTHFILPQAI